VSKVLAWFSNLFPVWVVLGGIAALIHPGCFMWFTGRWIVGGLAVIMLGMGITLRFEDFRHVLRMPRAVAVGLVAQFTIMPLLGWGIARLLKLDTPYAVGLILVACCPGGTASNVVSYLARANVALSVLMTMCSTFAAVLLTPLLTKALAGTYVPVDAWKLFLDTTEVVLAPVLAGLLLHQFAPRMVKWVQPVSPPIAVITIALICASVIGQQADRILHSGGRILGAVFLLHAGGFALGYGMARLLRHDTQVCRTIAIEVGMQNSGLGVVLARTSFPNLPAAPIPCAISATFHSVIGSVLAGIWRLRPPPTTPADPALHSQAEGAHSI